MGKIIFFGFLLFWVPSLLFAQEYPIKPINILVSHGPATSVDVAVRLLASPAEKLLGQPFVVTNNGGGGGSVGLGIVAKAKPDGYHLVGGVDYPYVLLPHLRDLPYKLEDFALIMQFAENTTMGILVKADSPWKTLKELVEFAKKNPGKFTCSVSGVNSNMYIAMAYIAKEEGIQWTAIPYPAGDPNYPLLGGHVTASCSGPVYIPHVQAGTLRLLATCGTERSKVFPEVPTLQELGYNFSVVTRCLISAPKGTPLSVVKKLDDTFRKAMDNPELVNYLEKFDYLVRYRNNEELTTRLKEEKERIGNWVIQLKIPKEK